MDIIAWEKLSDYIGKRLPAVIPVAGKHGIALVVGRNASSLSLRIPVGEGVSAPVSPFREVAYAIASVDGAGVLELTTSSGELFHAFYLFSTLVAEHIEERGDEVLNAVRRAQHVLGQLLVRRPLLSEERQVGLIGELCLLAAVLRRRGKAGFDAWVGPLGERHDFRYGDTEIEVKSTTSGARIHRVNGAGQLEASPGRSLYILSLQFELGGMDAGETLAGRVEAVNGLLANDVELLTRFRQQLGALGYQAVDAALYMQRYQFRSRPVLVPVDSACPKITLDALKTAIPDQALARIGEITYEVDLSGLGVGEATDLFRNVLMSVDRLE